jgi:hypothetical protein
MRKFSFISIWSFVVALLFVHLSHGQSEAWNDRINDLTRQIADNPTNAGLYLQRSRLRMNLFESHQDSRFLELDFPVSRVGIETLELALADSSRALELDPKLADAYFQRAEIRSRHPDIVQFGKYKLLFPLLSRTQEQEDDYQEYSESEKPKIAAQIVKDQILADLQTGLQLHPESTAGLNLRWASLCVLGETELVLSEVNETLQQPSISDDMRIMSLRIRWAVFLTKSQIDGGQVDTDVAEVQKYEQAFRDEERKQWAKGQVSDLSEQLSDDGISPLNRASILSQRAQMFQDLEMDDAASQDRAESRSIIEEHARKEVSVATTRLSADDLSVQERIQTLATRARNFRYLGQTENALKDEMDAAKLECEPRIASLTQRISEAPQDSQLRVLLLRERAKLYKRIGRDDLEQADLDLANKLRVQ